jgi:group I intron endonuclease
MIFSERWGCDVGVIYIIKNKVNGMVYIGKTGAAQEERWKTHKNSLRKNKHDNSKIQKEWNTYGEDNFVFEILEVAEKSHLYKLENMWIKSYGNGCYNITGNPNKAE